MTPIIATAVCLVGIAGLFWLDREPRARTSWALWIPTLWMAIACSRPLYLWLHPSASVDTVSDVMQGNPLDRAVYAGLLLLGLIALSRRMQVWQILKNNWAILLFFSYGLVSLFWADYPGTGAKRWVKTFGDVVMVLIVLSDPKPIAALRRLFTRLSFVLIPVSILFVKYIREYGIAWNPWTSHASVTGVTTNKNSLGAICLVFGLAALWSIIGCLKNRQRPAWKRHLLANAVILTMVFYLFYEADSMTSLMSFAMGSTILIAGSMNFFQRRRALIHSLIAFMVLASVSVLFLQSDPQILKAIGRNPTLTDRTFLWQYLLTQVQSPWLGTGFGNFWAGTRLVHIWQKYPVLHLNEAHNGYLSVYLNLGWVGIGFLMAFLASAYRTALRSWKNGHPAGALLLAYLLSGFVYNFTEAAFFKMQAIVWLFFLVAALDVPRPVRRRKHSVEKVERRPMELVA